MDQPIADPISGSSLRFLNFTRGNQELREDPELDNYPYEKSKVFKLHPQTIIENGNGNDQ